MAGGGGIVESPAAGDPSSPVIPRHPPSPPVTPRPASTDAASAPAGARTHLIVIKQRI